jgi:hypothetical protein
MPLQTEFRLRTVLVDRAQVERNDETGGCDPVFTVIDGDREYRGTRIEFSGPATLCYDRTKKHGQRVWIETNFEVNVRNDEAGTESIFPPLVDVRE